MIGLIKDELEGKVTTEFAVLRPKTYSYLKDDRGTQVIKKAEGTKKCVLKKYLNLIIIKTAY